MSGYWNRTICNWTGKNWNLSLHLYRVNRAGDEGEQEIIFFLHKSISNQRMKLLCALDSVYFL